MINIASRREVARFTASVVAVSVLLSVGPTLILGRYFGVGITPGGYLISVIMPIVVAAPVSYMVADALRRVTFIKQQIEILATRDALTEVLNRRAFLERAADQWQLLQAGGAAASLVLLDLDNFKAINDRYGHAAGDAALTEVAKALAKGLRSTDLVGRLGGEEFAVFLRGPETTAVAASERIATLIAEQQIPTDDGAFSITASFGVAEIAPAESLESAIKRADRAMYEAKARGRHRVVAASAIGAVAR